MVLDVLGTAVQYKVYARKGRNPQIKYFIGWDEANPTPERQWTQFSEAGDAEAAVRRRVEQQLRSASAAPESGGSSSGNGAAMQAVAQEEAASADASSGMDTASGMQAECGTEAPAATETTDSPDAFGGLDDMMSDVVHAGGEVDNRRVSSRRRSAPSRLHPTAELPPGELQRLGGGRATGQRRALAEEKECMRPECVAIHAECVATRVENVRLRQKLEAETSRHAALSRVRSPPPTVRC
mmetsp:Transcript_35698/g.76212  ORF Transcript_35698/g.76212 Transcript_35698/m.76212 type:complete len:240 (-) Transcript_35698:307-1026(-)